MSLNCGYNLELGTFRLADHCKITKQALLIYDMKLLYKIQKVRVSVLATIPINTHQ